MASSTHMNSTSGPRRHDSRIPRARRVRRMPLILLAAMLAAAILPAESASGQTFRRSEFSISYGFIPSTNWIDSYNGLLDAHYGDATFNLSGWGAVTAGYNFNITKRFSLGLQVVYSSNKEKYNSIGTTVHNRYWGVMPNVKWTWASLRVVSFYSRVGMGISFSKAKGGDISLTQSQFAFQMSAFGIETNGRLAFYAEAGVGQSGSILLGGKWKF